MRLIDADALKADYGMKDDCKDCEKEIQGYVRECQYNAVYTKMDFCGWIDSVPTIEERKTGKWIKAGHWGRCYKCDQCGNYLDFDGVNAGRGDANFCPNCGADMRGE